MKKKKLPLAQAWERRLKLRAEGNKLLTTGAKFMVDGYGLMDKLVANGNTLLAEGNKIWGEGYKLWAEGDRLWLDAVKDAHLGYELIWRNDDWEWKLSNGDVYRHDQKGG